MIMMLRMPAFLDLLTLWRGWRRAARKYLSFAPFGSDFRSVAPPLPLADCGGSADCPWEADEDEARPPVSWLGLGQSFSAVEVADCDGSKRSRLPVECG
ncbi:hypothetical protein O8B93_17315 [Agrobacterium rhizogenes]|uniref:hypothetical protein n=1 Tax=Rhizobium rhizogenes TaxID=359 RepID=UPI0022B70617|nr:hypothetical protein [Rhizobium rhizogenes]MCZ7449350.1 hypothetical protein [Rhizobium rhizogenes]